MNMLNSVAPRCLAPRTTRLCLRSFHCPRTRGRGRAERESVSENAKNEAARLKREKGEGTKGRERKSVGLGSLGDRGGV